jgi:hypothetical protein
MIIDQAKQPCAREGCACEVPAGQTYCGPHCANASGENFPGNATHCACGHDACSSRQETGQAA